MVRPPGVLTPRRIAMALVIAFVGMAVGVAASGFAPELRTGLPETFQPAQPQVGDQALYRTVRLAEGAGGWQPVGPALDRERIEERPLLHTWDTEGATVVARQKWSAYADFISWGGERGAPLKWQWSDGTTIAENVATERTVWIGSPTHHSEMNLNGSELSILRPTVEAASLSESKSYLEGKSYITDTCLWTLLPQDIDLRMEVALERACDIKLVRYDLSDMPKTPEDLYAQGRITSGYGLGPGGVLKAVGMASTPNGDAVVFEYRNAGGNYAGIQFWYVEGIPYPVQLVADHPSYPGTKDVVFLAEWTRGTNHDGPQGPVEDLPTLDWVPPTPWGLDDTGVDLPLTPSEAWQQALRSPALGPPSRLAQWLAQHGDAWTELADGGIAQDGVYAWSFQVRDGEQRIAFTVTLEEPRTVALDAVPLRDPQVRVDYTSPVETPPDGVRAEKLPTMASLAHFVQTYRGEGDTNAWTLGWKCNKLWQVRSCDNPLEQGITVGASSRSNDLELNIEDAQIVERNAGVSYQLALLPDGRISRFDETRSDMAVTRGATTVAADSPSVQLEASAWANPPGLWVATIGAATGLLAILYLLWPYLKTGAVGLFSRVQPAEVLDHPRRRQLYEAIRQEPGVHFQALSRIAGSGSGGTDHHLRKLMEAGLVVCKQAGGYNCYFLTHTDRRTMAVSPLQRSATGRAVLQTLRDQPGITGAALAEHLGVNRGTAHHHLQRLVAAGIVAVRKDGRSVRYWAGDLPRSR